MTPITDTIQLNKIQSLLRPVTGGMPNKAYIGITHYKQKIQNHYQGLIAGDLEEKCQQAHIDFAFGFNQFGLIVEFPKPLAFELHDQNMQLHSNIKRLIKEYGVVFFRNAALTQSIADLGHKNNFAHLNFHSDRDNSHHNCYSLYTRDPSDPEQLAPRTASTLFIDNAVAYLQTLVEQQATSNAQGRQRKYEIFRQSDMPPLMNQLILEQAWNAPYGVGEVGVINNLTVLHSSYKHGFDTGYRIGARYLS